ncbi:MAG: hypothetical protein E7302_14835 [Butyrivibrio sp.]|nr:hypothetical protein [Butyrivibrio sp.]
MEFPEGEKAIDKTRTYDLLEILKCGKTIGTIWGNDLLEFPEGGKTIGKMRTYELLKIPRGEKAIGKIRIAY